VYYYYYYYYYFFCTTNPCMNEGYRSLLKGNTCNRDVAGLVVNPATGKMEPQYHVRAVVTGPKGLNFEQFLCYSSWRDDDRVVFILHCTFVRSFLPSFLMSIHQSREHVLVRNG